MQLKHTPPTLEEVMAARKPHKSPREYRQTLSRSERFAVFMHKRVGSVGFFLFLLCWTILWLGWNMFGPLKDRFDPGPAFVIWLFASNILQLILLPVIMVGQNIEGRAAEWRAQKDYEINQQAEREVAAILAHLENQNELLLELVHKIDRV